METYFDLDLNYILEDYYTYSLSKRYFDFNNIVDLSVEVDGDEYCVSGSVVVHDVEYHCLFKMDAPYNAYNFFCDCEFASLDEPCAHIGAVMFLLNELNLKPPFHLDLNDIIREKHLKLEREREEYERRYRKMVYQKCSNDTNIFLDECKDSYINEMTLVSSHEEFDIVPYFEYQRYSGWCVKFKVGQDKLYMIKNITQFLRHIESKSFVRYGKNLAFVHDMSMFNEHGQRLIDFLRDSNYLLMKRVPGASQGV